MPQFVAKCAYCQKKLGVFAEKYEVRCPGRQVACSGCHSEFAQLCAQLLDSRWLDLASGSRPWARFVSSTGVAADRTSPEAFRRKLEKICGQLQAVNPAAARIFALEFSVVVPSRDPERFPSREKAMEHLTRMVEDTARPDYPGEGEKGCLWLHPSTRAIFTSNSGPNGEKLRQLCYLLDTNNSVHDVYWWLR